MCGIVGLFLKDSALQPELGRHLATMLEVMCDRGPDSAGFAVYTDGRLEQIKITVRADGGGSAAGLSDELSGVLGTAVSHEDHDRHSVLLLPADHAEAARAFIAAKSDFVMVGSGRFMEIFKGVGSPQKVSRSFGLSAMSGTHGIGHTRMATESAVTVDGSHPFSTGLDQCLVHNGSLSNHNDWRRKLVRKGLHFQTENDSEVAAGYLTWRLSEGLTLGEALDASLSDLDGFFTFVVGTADGFGVLRDAISCKPAVLAETDRFVAFASEYRALVELPGIENANVWEPEPATVYFWARPA
jgi:methylamine---glutamate N-methyltransferase subunit A